MFSSLLSNYTLFARWRYRLTITKISCNFDLSHQHLQHMYEDEQLLHMLHVSLVGEEDDETHVHKGFVVGRRVINMDRGSGYVRLMQDYLLDNPVYNDDVFI